MKIYNTDNTTNSCPTTNTIISTSASIPTLTNVAIIPDNPITCNVACTERCQNLGRFRTLGVANIDPKQSYVCGSTTLKVCGNLEVCDDLTVNGNLTVIGGATINNLTVVDLTVTGNLVACDISACNIDISQNLTVGGDTTLVDVSATNIDISEDLTVDGHTKLVDVSANIITFRNNSQFFNWGVHIIPISGVFFELAMITRFGIGTITQMQNIRCIWGQGGLSEEEGGWIYPGYGGYGTRMPLVGPGGMPTWSDRSSYPTDGFLNTGLTGYSYAVMLPIPYNGRIVADLSGSRFSWSLGRYNTGFSRFVLTIEIWRLKCRNGEPGAMDMIAKAEIQSKCGHTMWGVDASDPFGGLTWGLGTTTDQTINASDAIGIYIRSNKPFPLGSAGSIHSPATFTLEIQRDI